MVHYGLFGLGVLSRDIIEHFALQNTQREKNDVNLSFTVGGMGDGYEYIKLMSQCLNLGPHNAYKPVHTARFITQYHNEKYELLDKPKPHKTMIFSNP